MGKIPLPDNINPGRIQGDRLSTASPDLAAPGRAMQGFGRAVQGLAAEWQANQDKMDGYNANLAMEKFASSADVSYQQNLQNSAPDGTDFLQKQEQALIKSYEETLKGIKRPEDQARFTTLFERIRGNQVVRGMNDAKEKGKSYVLATTNDSVSEWVKSGALKGQSEYNDYFENSIKPRIDSVVDDPLERQRLYGIVGKTLRDNYFRQNPQAAMPTQKKVDATPIGRAISSAAAELGIPAVDLATVISYETGGRFSTSIMGGKGGNYMGLIQFGPEERKRYGASAGQSVEEQMGAVVRYLKDRGLKPGMSIYDLYSTINAGTPGRYNASDGPGNTVKGHVDKMLASAHRKKAEALVGGQPIDLPGSGYVAPEMPQGGIFEGMDQQEWNAYVTAGQRAFKDSLDLGIERGEVSREMIDSAPIDDGDKATLLRRIDERSKDSASMEDYLSRLPDGLINPKDSGDRKTTGKLLDAAGGGKAIVQGDPAAVGAMYDLYDKTGIVPDNAKGAIEAMLRSKDPARVNTALSYLTEFDRRNHRAFQQEFDENTEGLMQQYRDSLDFATPKEAADKVMQSVDPATESVRRERKKEADKVAAKITTSDVMPYFDPSYLPFTQPGLTLAKDAEAQLMLDFQRLYVESYKQTGDESQAKKMAAEKLTRVWGVSEANRGLVMKWSPELLYGPQAMVNGSYDWMRQDVERGLEVRGYTRLVDKVVAGGKGGAQHEQVSEVLPYYLLADSQTIAEHQQGKRPSYQVWVMTEDGEYDIVPSRFTFDPTDARARARQNVEIQQKQNLERRKRLDEELIRQQEEGVAPIPGGDPLIGTNPGAGLAPADLNQQLGAP